MPSISGLFGGGEEHRLSLYADDLLLLVSDPTLSVPHITHALLRFGTFFGYKLNFSKSECYPVNNSALQIQDNVLLFKMSRNGFKCLGINITRDIKNLYQEIFAPLLVKVKFDLKKWRSLPLVLGRKSECHYDGCAP